ncbi:MAG: hypothetical protein AB197_00960 [Parcubacteria bacterium C7867-002]|nr:MAG: hypothetical protein AB197_00960 [Parcubacteria bacterium C7867-002]
MVTDLLFDAKIFCLGSDVVSRSERKHTRPAGYEQCRMIIASRTQIHLNPFSTAICEVDHVILMRLAILYAYFVSVKVHIVLVHTTCFPYPHAGIEQKLDQSSRSQSCRSVGTERVAYFFDLITCQIINHLTWHFRCLDISPIKG